VAVAEAWAHAGRSDLAVTTLVRAIERFPDEVDLLVALGRVWLDVAESRGDTVALGKAREALRRAVARRSSPAALTLLGRVQLLAGEPVQAMRTLQQATATLPVDVAGLRDLATAAERAGRIGVAREALIEEATLLGDGVPARDRAGRAARIATLSQRLGDRDATRAWLERAVAAAPDDRTLAIRLASLEPSPSAVRAGDPPRR
jgi:predicted Zn-dependent protease